MKSVIEIKNVNKNYGKHRGVIDLDFEVYEQEMFGFIGPNGAGKSTTIKLLLNFIYPDTGSMKVFGMDAIEKTKEIKKELGYVPSEVRFYSTMKVSEIFHHVKAIYQMDSMDYCNELCERFDIDVTKRMEELSLGNKKKIALVCALMHKPKLLILDEPSNGLDPLMQKHLFTTLKEHQQEGATVFLSSHNLKEVQDYCDRAAFIKEGKLVFMKKMDEFASKKRTVTLTTDDIDEFKDYRPDYIEQNKIRFMIEGDYDVLMKLLNKVKIKDILIEEADLEQEFMGYYEEDESNANTKN